jgi:hypothetical protein
MNTIHGIMIYAVSAHNNLDSSWKKPVYSNTFPGPSDIHYIKFSKAAFTLVILNFDVTPFTFCRLNLSTSNFRAARLLTDSLSLTFVTIRQQPVPQPAPIKEGAPTIF